MQQSRRSCSPTNEVQSTVGELSHVPSVCMRTSQSTRDIINTSVGLISLAQ